MSNDLFNSEWDAQTLAEAAAINSNTARLAAAVVAAQQLKKDALKKAEDLDKIQTQIYTHPSSVKAREELKSVSA